MNNIKNEYLSFLKEDIELERIDKNSLLNAIEYIQNQLIEIYEEMN